MDDILREYRDALIRLDELNMMLGNILMNMRTELNKECGYPYMYLDYADNISRKIDAMIPVSIISTRQRHGNNIEWKFKKITQE